MLETVDHDVGTLLGLPAAISRCDSATRCRFFEFFAAEIRNPNTRKAYYRSASAFLDWMDGNGLQITSVRPIHVSAWVELQMRRYSIASVKQQLAALKVLFDWLLVGQIIATNPAKSVRSPRHSVRKGKTPALSTEEARQLIEAIDTSTIIGLRDRALIGIMIYAFARIGAALSMKVDDVYIQNRRLWIRLHEKGGKLHDMPCHHELEEWLDAYIAVADNADDANRWLFRSIDRNRISLTEKKLAHANAYCMVKKRAKSAGLETRVTNHSFRATGITAYLSNGGTLEQAARMANHASTRTTQLYDRRDDQITLTEIERIRL